MPCLDVAVIGAGAAGLATAVHLRGLKAALFEAAPVAGRKLAAAGGGRANFANQDEGPQFYLCENGFCANALRAFPREKILGLLHGYGLAWEIRGGKYFLQGPASALRDALLADFRRHGGRAHLDCACLAVEKKSGRHLLRTSGGDFEAEKIILAAGSPAAPALGGSPSGLALAESLGLAVNPPAPALAPLIFRDAEREKFAALAGVSLFASLTLVPASGGEACAEEAAPAHVRLMRNQTRSVLAGDLLFTHRGLSGPLALNASLFWRKGMALRADFLPGQDFEKLLDENEKGGRSPRSLLKSLIPARAADLLLPEKLARIPIARLGRAQRRLLAAAVNRFSFTPKGVAGLRQAEICRGGVKTAAIDPRTLECRHSPGLFLAGEILDVAGMLGGYNLAWAFASGFCAARAACCGRVGGSGRVAGRGAAAPPPRRV